MKTFYKVAVILQLVVTEGFNIVLVSEQWKQI